jgi:hypothetical protein
MAAHAPPPHLGRLPPPPPPRAQLLNMQQEERLKGRL